MIMDEKPKFCGTCGSPLRDKAKFCGKCGERIQVAVDKQANAPPQYDADEGKKHEPTRSFFKGKKKIIWVLATVLALYSFAGTGLANIVPHAGISILQLGGLGLLLVGIGYFVYQSINGKGKK